MSQYTPEQRRETQTRDNAGAGLLFNPHSPDDGLISPTLASIQI